MNVDDAAYAVVHDYPGGADALAARMNKSAAVLCSKVRPNCTTHHLTLREAQDITALTDDPRILEAFARDTGRIVLKMPTDADDQVSDMAVLELVARVWMGQGHLGSAVHHALTDSRLTPTEYEQICEAGSRAQAHIAGLLQRLQGMVEKA